MKLQEVFQLSGFETWVASNGRDALKLVAALNPDLIVIELELPEKDGMDFCRNLREIDNNWTPIIFISDTTEELNVVLGLELGADDYMAKPLRLRELVARAKSVLRRGNLCIRDFQENSATSDNMIENGELMLYPSRFSVYKNGEQIELTHKEFEIIYYLLQNKNKIISRAHLLEYLSSNKTDMDERIVDVFISRIRNKIEPQQSKPKYIKTVRNIGYMMNTIPVVRSNKITN